VDFYVDLPKAGYNDLRELTETTWDWGWEK